MGWLKGKTKEISGTPNDIRPLRQNIASQLMQGIGGGALSQGFQGVLGQGGAPPAQDMSFFYNNILQPYNELFQAQRNTALGQAKESAGNLTGSGYNNILGSATAESLAGQQALTAQTLMGLREQELQRQQNLMGMLFQFAGQGVGPNQSAYQPGFLDAILPFAGQLGGTWLANRNKPTTATPGGGGQQVLGQPAYPGGGVGPGYKPFDYGQGLSYGGGQGGFSIGGRRP